jgi:hypothetical protein
VSNISDMNLFGPSVTSKNFQCIFSFCWFISIQRVFSILSRSLAQMFISKNLGV